MPRQRCSQCQGEEGFSLLEGMLAAVILGTGLLAMSGMQTIALVKNVDASELTRVTSVASDMMERVYFNRRNAVSYNGIDTQNSTTCNNINAAQAQAKGDCLIWQGLLTNTQLQNVRGQVIVDLNPIAPTVLGQRTVQVTITWLGSMKTGSTVKRARSITLNRVVAPE
jgi:type IV pilus assembly protein PilV